MFNKSSGTVLAIWAMGAVLVSGGCSRGTVAPDDPKAQLTAYISKSFAVRDPSDRKMLTDHLTGGSKIRMTAWSDEQFREAFVESKRQFIKLRFDEVKAPSPKEVNITYELTYIDQSKGVDAKVTNKKLAQMLLEDGRWMISDVRNIKELVEYKNELSLP